MYYEDEYEWQYEEGRRKSSRGGRRIKSGSIRRGKANFLVDMFSPSRAISHPQSGSPAVGRVASVFAMC